MAAPLVALAAAEGARERSLRDLVGPGDLPCGRDEAAAQILVDRREARVIERYGFEELDAATELGGLERLWSLHGGAR